MSDAQIDAGDNGAQAQDSVAGWIGDKNDGEAVRWYGMYSMFMGVGSIFFYMFMNGEAYVAGNFNWYLYQMEFFIPVFISWLMVSFFDGEFMRGVFETVTTLSILGPFAMHWYALAQFYLAGEGSYLDSLEFWIWFALYGAFTIFQQIIQVVLLPQVYDWADSASTLDNESQSLIAAMF